MRRGEWDNAEALLDCRSLVLHSRVGNVQLFLLLTRICTPLCQMATMCQVPTFLAELASLKAQA